MTCINCESKLYLHESKCLIYVYLCFINMQIEYMNAQLVLNFKFVFF